MFDCAVDSEPQYKKSKHVTSKIVFAIDSDSELDSDEVTVELNMYRNTPAETDITKDPLLFWMTNEHAFPRLCKLAKCYLSMPGSSVPVERLFSSAGELISKKRNSLNPSNANVLLCLHS